MLVVHKPSTPPALTRAIQITTANIPQATARVTATLDTLLKEILTSQHQEAWKFSRLNKNGFPVEFTFNSLDASVRYATEVASPEVDPVERLSHAEALLAELGVPVPENTMYRLRQVQTSGALEWGAWIGVRHRPEGDRYKLYVQVPDTGSATADALMQGYLGTEPLLPNNTARLVAIGQELGTPRIEFYFKIDHLGLQYWEVSYLLRRFGLAARQIELLSLIEETRGYSLDEARPKLPQTTYGFSLSVSSGEPMVFSLFGFVGPLLGGDGQIKERLLSLAEKKGWNFDSYAALTKPLAAEDNYNLHHNAIAFIVPSQGPIGLHISLSPPEVVAADLADNFQDFRPVQSSPTSSEFNDADINWAIASAQKFLINAQHPEGWWSDFQLAPGRSDEWVTAYVGTAIASLSTHQTKAIAFKAWRWLIGRCQSSPGWGYNALVPRDADSTVWALQLAAAIGCSNWEPAQLASEFLLQHLRPGGGIATYADDRLIRRFIGASEQMSFAGWCSPQVCVTAAASSLPQLRFAAGDFLRQTQSQDGSWKSYWWCEDEYATALAAAALSKSVDGQREKVKGERENTKPFPLPPSPFPDFCKKFMEPQDSDRVQRAIQWAVTRINSDGSVSSSIKPLGSAFASAWILQLLLLDHQPETFREQRDRLVRWLLNHQNPDGSWNCSAGLRVPPPNIIYPETQPNWVLHGLIENAISLDQLSIFTTATVLQSLHKYAKFICRFN